jgi:hypothetical protein
MILKATCKKYLRIDPQKKKKSMTPLRKEADSAYLKNIFLNFKPLLNRYLTNKNNPINITKSFKT